MENNERILTPEERLKLIQEIANNGGLFAINELLNKIAGTKKQASDEVVDSRETEISPINNITDTKVTSIDTPVDTASIYKSEFIPLVQEDNEQKREEMISGVIQERGEFKEKTGPVLERKLTPPNPYADSRTVAPGSNGY